MALSHSCWEQEHQQPLVFSLLKIVYGIGRNRYTYPTTHRVSHFLTFTLIVAKKHTNVA